jgi:cobalamin biosynthesis Mg chelatase CobN
VYAANNPSESLLAKRRAYSTIVSHNVPPYARAGLYRELSSVRDLLDEYRSSPPQGRQDLIPLVATAVEKVGLFDDCPYTGVGAAEDGWLTGQVATAILNNNNNNNGDSSDSSRSNHTTVDGEALEKDFGEFVSILYEYLNTVQNRLFSQGLHVLGQPLQQIDVLSYLDALYGDEEGGRGGHGEDRETYGVSVSGSTESTQSALLASIAAAASQGLPRSQMFLRSRPESYTTTQPPELPESHDSHTQPAFSTISPDSDQDAYKSEFSDGERYGSEDSFALKMTSGDALQYFGLRWQEVLYMLCITITITFRPSLISTTHHSPISYIH